MPEEIKSLLLRLNACGYTAYAVGGCVRDSLMGRTPKDWDVCTSAQPAQIKECFAEHKTIDIGEAHGTVAVMLPEETVEITTFRIDGAYTDGRHPETVEFTDRIEEDLARRDFTINAMAFHPETGLIDPFGGREDISWRRIRCVGEAEKRFSEDGLRIMRGLRFAATLDFEIETACEKAMERCIDCLKKVAKERIGAEFSKLILGAAADRVLERYRRILAEVLPGFCTAKVGRFSAHLETRLAAVFPEDTEGCLRRLRFSGRTAETAGAIARLAVKTPPSDEVEIKKILSREGEQVTLAYYEMFGCRQAVERVLAAGGCFRREDLAVCGEDLLAAGIPKGKAVGAQLSQLLQLVMEEKLENDRQTLLTYLSSEREEKDEH